MATRVHPFKAAIAGLIDHHFDISIAKKFELVFELDKYNLDRNKSLQKQKQDDNPIMEVHYKLPSGILVYICDLYPWESKPATERRLLKGITDKVKTNQFGDDWEERNDGKISQIVKSGKYETPDELIKEGMA